MNDFAHYGSEAVTKFTGADFDANTIFLKSFSLIAQDRGVGLGALTTRPKY